MFLLLGIALSLLTAGGIAALCCNRSSRWPHWIGCVTAVSALFCAAAAAFYQLIAKALPGLYESQVCMVFFDELAALFMIPVAVVGALAAIHSTGYLRGHDKNKAGVYWFFFEMTLAAMLCVLLMVTPLTFLLAWELMGIFSFALVAYEYRESLTRRAAWIYLLACEAGGLALILTFSVMQKESGWLVFLLLLTGFGLKAGLPLLHVWLPVAHPAAPAPVSAVMSASMINLGLFGIIKFLPAADVSFAVCGWSLLICGMLCALPGVIFALAQKNLKRLLAYSSVENMGIICIGLGLGFLGFSIGDKTMGCSGFCGAFLHIFNHGTLKSSLFLLAGSIFKAVGTLDIDRMGGLMKRMPFSGALFTFSGIGISGIPPFNGFMGEFLIYVGFLRYHSRRQRSLFRDVAGGNDSAGNGWWSCRRGIRQGYRRMFSRRTPFCRGRRSKGSSVEHDFAGAAFRIAFGIADLLCCHGLFLADPGDNQDCRITGGRCGSCDIFAWFSAGPDRYVCRYCHLLFPLFADFPQLSQLRPQDGGKRHLGLRLCRS